MSLYDRLKKGLEKTRDIWARVGNILSRPSLGPEEWRALEELLISADVGYQATAYLIKEVKVRWNNHPTQAPLQVLQDFIAELLTGDESSLGEFPSKPWVILLVGVNGGGKTTTAGKLAHLYARNGYRVVISASDTFRAAAIDQVAVWCERSGARLVRQQPGADPSAVTFDALNSAIKRGDDLVIVDTAGRLHTKKGLMEELAKMVKVMKRLVPDAPHEVLLVIDAITGQNGIVQAKTFTQAVGTTGLVITKLDGSARGGVVIPIKMELGLPIKFIGLGEDVDDLQPFHPQEFAKALLS